GFDARGIEIIQDGRDLAEVGDDDEASPMRTDDRAWLIQCKREKTISPKKLMDYLGALLEPERENLHGIIFAAACDFSKSARDAFRVKTRELGFGEAYLWGKGEIEDMLFQPKNDHLLFAYFGISLQTRRRTLRTEIRSKLAMKRKAQRILED